jgi:hypothetical protein
MTVWWFDGEKTEDYGPGCAGRVFKWVLFKKGGDLMIAAMPHDTGLDFHIQLLAAVVAEKGWASAADADRFVGRSDNHFYEAGIEVLGGGTRLRNGSIRNYSYRFGAIPDRRLPEVMKALGLS